MGEPNYTKRRYIKHLIKGGTIQKYNELLDQSFHLLNKVITNRGLPYEILGVSMTLFHYYTYYKSMREFDKIQVIIASIFLGCKLQNCFISVEEFIKDYTGLKNYTSQAAPNGNKHPQLATNLPPMDLVKYEIELLNFLGFDVNVETPYPYLEQILSKIEIKDKDKIMNFALKIVNDTYRRPLAIYFNSKYLALSAIYIAIKLFTDTEVDTNNTFSLEEYIENNKQYNKDELSKCLEYVLVLYEEKYKKIN